MKDLKKTANYWSRLMWSCRRKYRPVAEIMKEYGIKYSPRQNKTYVVEYKGKKIHFGDPKMRIKAQYPKRRKAYCKRSAGIK